MNSSIWFDIMHLRWFIVQFKGSQVGFLNEVVLNSMKRPGWVVQLVTCPTADICLPDPGVASPIPACSHTFVKIDHETISTAILLPSFDSSRVVVSYK